MLRGFDGGAPDLSLLCGWRLRKANEPWAPFPVSSKKRNGRRPSHQNAAIDVSFPRLFLYYYPPPYRPSFGFEIVYLILLRVLFLSHHLTFDLCWAASIFRFKTGQKILRLTEYYRVSLNVSTLVREYCRFKVSIFSFRSYQFHHSDNNWDGPSPRHRRLNLISVNWWRGGCKSAYSLDPQRFPIAEGEISVIRYVIPGGFPQ